MTNDLVTFNVRYEESVFKLKMESPTDVHRFIQKLKNELNLEDTVDLILLYPTLDGKMETKLCYNAKSKEIYCSVEIVVIVIHELLEDDPKSQIMNLTKKVNRLSSQFDEYLLYFDNKLKENTSSVLESIRSMLSKQSQKNSSYKVTKDDIGEQSKPNGTLDNGHTKPQKKVKKDEEKTSITSVYTDTPKLTDSVNDKNQEQIPNNSSNTSAKPKDIDNLLKMLVEKGYNNTIQNIIALKRFDNDFEKTINYLKSNAV
ncbi:uncharacterized protein LOC112685183 isoform X2 [Sipha flava]|uniref:Uncharacterized protein LOC112685183 isoform X2 n=1 Tax=Sipha flava TaxID=143950 RepID=A0A8B8FPB7_9HEMI|nr:uncharacterized protein LOC112685183 isoform X2 [Sipha flava]